MRVVSQSGRPWVESGYAEHAVQVHALIPGARLAGLPGATHVGMLRRANLVVPLVTGFLR